MDFCMSSLPETIYPKYCGHRCIVFRSSGRPNSFTWCALHNISCSYLHNERSCPDYVEAIV